MEIQLSKKQFELIQDALSEQVKIKEKAENELGSLQKKLDAILSIILELNNTEYDPAIQLIGDKLVIPDKKENTEK